MCQQASHELCRSQLEQSHQFEPSRHEHSAHGVGCVCCSGLVQLETVSFDNLAQAQQAESLNKLADEDDIDPVTGKKRKKLGLLKGIQQAA